MNAPRRTKFYLDKQNKKWLGVCSGIADYTGLDVTLVRIGLVVLTLLGGFPWTLIAYWVAAWMAAVVATQLLDLQLTERLRSNPMAAPGPRVTTRRG